MEIKRVGVVGAGTIGRSVAQSLAENGIDVSLVDAAPSQLASAVDQIRQDIEYFSLYRSPLEEGADRAVARIATSTSLESMADCDLVVENVTEGWEIKRKVYTDLDRICPSTALFGVNTSAVPITRIASAVRRPERVIGVHYMNPVPLMKTVEVMRGLRTSDETVDTVLVFLRAAGKRAVVVNDSPGFVANRVYMPTINEAAFCVHEGVATVEQVDEIFRGCFGHRMGPLETADLIGLDTVLRSLIGLYDDFKDSKFRPAPNLQQLVDAGMLGRKTGQGFHSHFNGPIEGESLEHE